jgi:hypothetical protein
MSFREKSAWVMAAVMTLAGLYYLRAVVSASDSSGAASPPAGALAGYVCLVVVGSVVAQVVLALSAPKEAAYPADERERPALQRAGHRAGIVLAAGAVLSLGGFLYRPDGNLLFHLVLGSLIASQIAEYAFQIAFLRRGA